MLEQAHNASLSENELLWPYLLSKSLLSPEKYKDKMIFHNMVLLQRPEVYIPAEDTEKV